MQGSRPGRSDIAPQTQAADQQVFFPTQGHARRNARSATLPGRTPCVKPHKAPPESHKEHQMFPLLPFLNVHLQLVDNPADVEPSARLQQGSCLPLCSAQPTCEVLHRSSDSARWFTASHRKEACALSPLLREL